MSSPMSFHHTDVPTSSVKFDDPGKLYHQETRRRSNKSDLTGRTMQRSNVRGYQQIHEYGNRSREEGDGPSVLICFYNAPEDLGTPRPEHHHVGTQTLPPGACGDASTPSCKIHSVCPEQRVMAEGGDSGDKPKATVWSQRTPQAEFPQKGSRGEFPGPVLEPRPSKNIQPMLNRSAEKSSTTRLTTNQLICQHSKLQKMGCSCSTSSDEWSDSDSDSSLSELPPYIRRSTKTVELRKHTVTQHACLDKEVKGDGSGTCEETLESHPRVALPRLSTSGEANNIDGSKPSKPVHSTLVGRPSIAIMMTEASGDQQRPMVDPEPQRGDKDDTDDLEKAPNQCAIDEPGPSTVRQNGLLPTPNPEPDTGLLPPPPPEPDTSLMPPPPPEPDTGLMPPPPPEPDTSLMPPPPPEPDTGLMPPPPPEPDTSLMPPPPPEPDTSLMPPPPPEPDTGLMPPPPPEPDTGLMPPPPPELSVSSEVNVRLAA
ncbi:hypothetical protein D4764_17G0001490 [Takifugu flavidus]|uniref:Uncharacterized protein n=1 Tax=Takifugu flavidus TaxID=433684 RepID=A0A5C6NUJ8_9TELE|nr:hypothetical protein D4764_17G0001490 [Takifugu flavidus]